MEIEKLQYITQENASISHIEGVTEACIAGVKWIQLRVKNKSKEEYLTIAKEAKIICDIYDVKLIINDDVEIAKQVGAHGVHLGKSDMSPKDARAILGDKPIIGVTANSFEEIQELINDEIDYIGLGPYQFTETKENLQPALGLEGYERIQHRLLVNVYQIPVIAVGGIDIQDIEALLETGIHGVALSGALTKDFSKIQKINEIIHSELSDIN